MNRKIQFAFAFLSLLLLFLSFGYAQAQGLVPDCGGKATECGLSDFVLLINNIIKFTVKLVISVSVIVFAWAGFKYLTNRGDTGKVKEAHGIFMKVIVGLLIVLLAWLIVNTILKLLTGKDLRGWERDEVKIERVF